MGIYVGHRERKIGSVSDSRPENSSFEILEIDSSFGEIHPEVLMRDFEVRRGKIVSKTDLDPKNMRVAFVGVYKIQCGISTYSEWLWAEQIKLAGEHRIFAEVVDGATDDINVVRCWKRGLPLTELVEKLREYDPDVIFVQHEYGVFPVARHWLAFIAAIRKYRTVVTLHSVYRHKDKTICEAALPEIVVHSPAAAKILLEEKKVPGRVHTIYHGSFPCESAEKYWNLYQSNHTIVQFGFGFKYKGWERAIETVAILKKNYPDVFFTGLFSETSASKDLHDSYFQELDELIDRLGVRENVALLRGFQSEECLDSFLRTNQTALFPYVWNGEHTVYGCSGAARYAMAKGVPVVVSDVPQFEDLEGVVPRCKDPREMAEAIGRIFDGQDSNQVDRQNKFLLDSRWAVAAERHFALLRP